MRKNPAPFFLIRNINAMQSISSALLFYDICFFPSVLLFYAVCFFPSALLFYANSAIIPLPMVLIPPIGILSIKTIN